MESVELDVAVGVGVGLDSGWEQAIAAIIKQKDTASGDHRFMSMLFRDALQTEAGLIANYGRTGSSRVGRTRLFRLRCVGNLPRYLEDSFGFHR